MASPTYSMHDQMEWLMWLVEQHLIRNSNDCQNCQRPMALALVHRTESPEGYSWRCRAYNTRAGVWPGSFFANCVLSTEKIVMLMFYWIYELKCKHVMLFENITNLDIIVNYITTTSFDSNVVTG